jgi:hypothetical protein
MKREIGFLSSAILCGALLLAAAPAAAQGRPRPAPQRDDGDRIVRPRADRDAKSAAAPSASADVRLPVVSEVFFCETSTTQCRSTNSTFSAGKLRDLFVFVTWPGAAGNRVQTLEFYLPDGSLYQKKETAFSARAGIARARATPGAVAVPDEYLTSSQGVPTVVTSLPVAGTYITQRNLFGTWTVRVLLDGKPVASSQFTLKAPPDKP